jgi:2,3-bisphosphoglycerate-dependent phosphoglycerate mutase
MNASLPSTSDATPVILVRHAQSEWNLAQRFTGWADVGLTDAGRAEAQAHNPLYADLGSCAWPPTESLADTTARVAGFWNTVVAPVARAGRRLLVVTHGNTLRGLIMHLDGLSDEQVESLEVPTGKPLVYWVDRAGQTSTHAYVE